MADAAFLCLLAELNNPPRRNINTRATLNIQQTLQVHKAAVQVCKTRATYTEASMWRMVNKQTTLVC